MVTGLILCMCKSIKALSVLHICEYFALNFGSSVKRNGSHTSCGLLLGEGGEKKKIKNLMPCEVPPQKIRMHNHNVVKDEIKSRNYFQLDFETESDPLRVLSL